MKFREEKIRGKTIGLSSKSYKEKIRAIPNNKEKIKNKKVLDILDFFILYLENLKISKSKTSLGVIE